MNDAAIGRLYSDYYPRSTFSENDWKPHEWAPGFLSWLAGKSGAYMYVPPNVKILDVGCGFGGSLGYHRNRGCSAHGTEMDSNALRIADMYDLDIRQGAFDSKEWEAASFDYVTLDQVIEHSYEPLKLLRDVRIVLKPGGTLLMTTPNAESLLARLLRHRWINWHPPYHAFLYPKQALRILLENADFSVAWIKTVTPSAWMYYQAIHCGLHKKQGQPTPFWDSRVQRDLFLREKLATRFANYINRAHIFSVATRLFDLFRAGDSFIICAQPNDSADLVDNT
jgi:2-polyprenyl-3-methyl-5-hydroxy-6-metoxy-1,4-benzoquinol methylase